MHAVGRASVNKPIFINIAYKGNPNSDEWVSYVGKGLVFDTGGLNIKPCKYYPIQLLVCSPCILISAGLSIYSQLFKLSSRKKYPLICYVLLDLSKILSIRMHIDLPTLSPAGRASLYKSDTLMQKGDLYSLIA
jgi:hypothetical protein